MGYTGEILAAGFLDNGGVLDGGKSLIPIITGGALAVGLAVKAFTKIDEGERGVRTHFGRPVHKTGGKKGQPYGILGSGIYIAVPFTHSIRRISIQNRPDVLPLMPVDIAGTQINVVPSIEWAVMDDETSILNAMFGVSSDKELKEAVVNICVSGLNKAVGSLTLDDIRTGESLIQSAVIDLSAGDLAGYGVELRRLRINNNARSIGEMIRQAGQYTPGIGAVVLDAIATDLTPIADITGK